MTGPRLVICLLRNDLRVVDNALLAAAQAHSACSHVLPLHVLDDRQCDAWGWLKGDLSGVQGPKTWHFGMPKMGLPRSRFILQTLADLKRNLQKCGSDLMVVPGKPEHVVAALVKSLRQAAVSVDAVYMQQEYTYEETQVEKAVQAAIAPTPLELFATGTLYHPHDLPFDIHRVPQPFTAFRKLVETEATPIRPVLLEEAAKCINGSGGSFRLKPLPPLRGLQQFWQDYNDTLQEHDVRPTDDALGTVPTVPAHLNQHDPRSAFKLDGGELAGMQRVKHYLFDTHKLSTYKDTRNGLVGEDYSTKFSAYLSCGALSPRYIYHQVKQYEQQVEANKSTYFLYFELLWRDFFHLVAATLGNRIFHLTPLLQRDMTISRKKHTQDTQTYRRGAHGPTPLWRQDMHIFNRWRDGQTGVPWVDASMRELRETGYMSNRGRQNVASFLAKDLDVDWRLGAEWFETMLVDHDAASNYGNWQYASGVALDPRENRHFNMLKQACDYDAQAEFVKLWCPELAVLPSADDVHKPWKAQSQRDFSLGRDYPEPIVVRPEWDRHSVAGNNTNSTEIKMTTTAVPGRSRIDLGLDTVLALLNALDNPHRRFKCIHVAGTNGKGSTTAFLAALLSTRHARVATYTSPHLLTPRDSIRINTRAPDAATFAHLLATVSAAAESARLSPTTFEVTTVAALVHFARAAVDVAVVEVGVGGRLDATNVWQDGDSRASVLASVVTPIGIDHAALLGGGLREIAAHKVGVMVRGGKCFVARQRKPAVLEVLEQEARDKEASLVHVSYDMNRSDGTYSVFCTGAREPCCVLPLSDIQERVQGYQYENLATALAVFCALGTSGNSGNSTPGMVQVIRNTRWPGRLDRVTLPIADDHVDALVDGAHNEDGARALRSVLDATSQDGVTSWIIGMTQGRSPRDLLAIVTRPGDQLCAVPFTQPEAMQWIKCCNPQDIVAAAQELGVHDATAHDSIEAALLHIKQHPRGTLVVVTGSLYLAADVYRYIGHET
ncbi:hypothetical protein RI367_005706 [Sorochytrium milnesiophthora]